MEEVNSKLDTILAFLLANDENFELDIIDESIDVPTLESGGSQSFTIPFAKRGILQTVYLKSVETDLPFTVEIDNGDGVIEYRAQSNLEFCYDVLDIIYVNALGNKELYLTITNDSDSPINFELCRIRGIEL